jgi:hypothetical protein
MPDIRDALLDDAEILAALRDGGRTFQVAHRLHLRSERPYLLRRLKRLERAGKVRRHERYSYVNDIYWGPAA